MKVEEEILFGHLMTTLNDAFKLALTSEDIGYESGSKIMNVPTPLHQEPQTYHVYKQENLSFRPATPRACPSPSYPYAVHCQLTYEDDDTMENHSSKDDILACHLPSTAEEEDDDMKEHFLTVSIDDDFWMKDPVLERHLCIHENPPSDMCPYPCLNDLNQLYLTQEDVQYIDLSDIFDFPDVMVSADDDIPSLEDTLKL